MYAWLWLAAEKDDGRLWVDLSKNAISSANTPIRPAGGSAIHPTCCDDTQVGDINWDYCYGVNLRQELTQNAQGEKKCTLSW